MNLSDRWDGTTGFYENTRAAGWWSITGGQSLSAEFSPVVQDSSTLLENVISMVDEQSYVYDEENRESVYKTMINRMFATMSNCFSVSMHILLNVGGDTLKITHDTLQVVLCLEM